jgi:hypothetical protein
MCKRDRSTILGHSQLNARANFGACVASRSQITSRSAFSNVTRCCPPSREKEREAMTLAWKDCGDGYTLEDAQTLAGAHRQKQGLRSG